MLSTEEKKRIIGEFKQGDADTGSPEVQVSLLTNRIAELTEHFKVHKKDYASKRGLLKLISRRKRLLEYLKRKSFDRYQDVISRLGLRK